MDDVQLKLTVRNFFGYVLAYLFWLLTISMGGLAVLEARNALNAVWPLLGSGAQWTWTLRPIDRFGLLFLGLVWLVYAIFCEHYYREAITLVRIRAHRGRKAPALQDSKASWWARELARLDLDILVPRFAITIAPPIAIWLVGWGIKELALFLITR